MKLLKILWQKIKEIKLKKIKYHLLLEKTYWDGRAYDKKEKDYENIKYETIREIENMVKEIDDNK
jgi:hypothetical protein